MKLGDIVWKCDYAADIPESIYQGIVVLSDLGNRTLSVRATGRFYRRMWHATVPDDSDIDKWSESWEDAIDQAGIEAKATIKRSLSRLGNLWKQLETHYEN